MYLVPHDLVNLHNGSQRHQIHPQLRHHGHAVLKKQDQNGVPRPVQPLPMFSGEGRELGRNAWFSFIPILLLPLE